MLYDVFDGGCERWSLIMMHDDSQGGGGEGGLLYDDRVGGWLRRMMRMLQDDPDAWRLCWSMLMM